MVEEEHVVAVVFAPGTPAPAAELTQFVAAVAGEILSRRQPPARMLWSSRGGAGNVGNADELLAERDVIHEIGPHRLGYGEKFIRLTGRLDSVIRTLAVERFDAREYEYPSLLPVSALRRCGLLDQPYHLMFGSYLPRDVYPAADAAGELPSADSVSAPTTHYCHPPAAFLQVLEHFSDAALPAPLVTVTSRGKAIRLAGEYHNDPRRPAEFTARAVVQMGERAMVAAAHRRLLDQLLGVIDLFGLAGYCEPARLAPPPSTQYELRLNTVADATVTAAIFRGLDRRFADNFAIRSPGSAPAYVASVEFGLEQLTYAFLCQHGIKASMWPESVRLVLQQPAVAVEWVGGNGSGH